MVVLLRHPRLCLLIGFWLQLEYGVTGETFFFIRGAVVDLITFKIIFIMYTEQSILTTVIDEG